MVRELFGEFRESIAISWKREVGFEDLDSQFFVNILFVLVSYFRSIFKLRSEDFTKPSGPYMLKEVYIALSVFLQVRLLSEGLDLLNLFLS